MTDIVRDYLQSKGYADHVIKGGVSRLVERWEYVVSSIARGEKQEYYDYLNDMDGRRILEEVLTIAPKEQIRKFKERVSEADRRAKEHLNEVDKCIWGAATAKKWGYASEKEWWYYHVPKNLEDDWPKYLVVDT